MIVAALAPGMRVGITAPSHAAIQNLLDESRSTPRDRVRVSAGIYKGARLRQPARPDRQCRRATTTSATTHRARRGHRVAVRRPEHRERFDLSVHRRGRPVLARERGRRRSRRREHRAARRPAAAPPGHPGRPSRAAPAPPSSSTCSTAQSARFPPAAAFCLTESWRMHPEVCAFVSERSYDATPPLARRLRPPSHRRVQLGRDHRLAGCALAVEHDGRSQAQPEEAEAIADALPDAARRRTVTDDDGAARELIGRRHPRRRALQPRASAASASACPTGVRVGTVDRSRAKQAPVVFFAMTCSSGEDVPRGIDFLFDRNRLNVAISRAQCLAVLVVKPAPAGRRLPDSSRRCGSSTGLPIRGDGCSGSCARSCPAQRPLTAAYVSITRLEAGCSPSCLTISRASPSSNGTSARRSVALHARGLGNVFGRSATMGASSTPSPRGLESFEHEINSDRELSLTEPDRLGEVSCWPLDRCYPDDAATIPRWVPEAPAGGVQKKQVAPSEPLRLAPPIDRERGPPFTQDPTQRLAVGDRQEIGRAYQSRI